MNKKVTGVFAYLGIIFWLIAYLAGDKEGARFYLNQGLILALVGLAGSILRVIPFLGGIVSWIVSVAVLVFAIIGIVSVLNDEEKPLPFIGHFQLLK